jgi:preprotein translocase subunit SecB
MAEALLRKSGTMADQEQSAESLAEETSNMITMAEPGPDSPMVRTVAQYLKDLSFENPRPFSRKQERDEPDFDIVIGVHSRKADDGDYMLEFSIRAEARSDEKTFFLTELIYVGCYSFANIAEDKIEAILHLQLAPMLFPYARQILDDVVQRGGYPPLHVEVNAINYLDLFKAHLERKKRDAGKTAQA